MYHGTSSDVDALVDWELRPWLLGTSYSLPGTVLAAFDAPHPLCYLL